MYLLKTGEKLLQTGVGIKFLDERVPALFFADDMVLMSDKKDDLNKLLRVLGGMLAKTRLEINCKKSQVLVIKGSKDETYNWNIYSHNQEIVGDLDEVRSYKYLGIINKGGLNPYNEHLTKMVTRAKQLSGAVRSKARDAWDPVTVGDKLWNCMACPAILYGCEILQMNQSTYDKLEVAQNSMGRSILGARKFCSVAAIRNELGWKSMRSRIYESKLKFWGKIIYQDDSRWAKASFLSSIYEGWRCKWHEEIMEIRRQLGIYTTVGINSYKEWCTRVKNAINEYERSTFATAKASMKTLMWYNSPFNEKKKLLPYIDGSKAASAFFNVKAGSWVLKHVDKGYAKCKLCGENDSEIHRLISCKELQSERINLGLEPLISDIRNDSKSDIETLGSLTMGSKSECLARGKMFLAIQDYLDSDKKNPLGLGGP